MSLKSSDPATLKKLMKIIYEKEKQIDKYKRQLREKEQAKAMMEHGRLGMTVEEKDEIAKEIMENKMFLETASVKLYGMESKIKQLEYDLEEEEYRNELLEEQVYECKRSLEEKDQKIMEMRTLKELFENTKLMNNTEISEKQRQIEYLIIDNENNRILLEQAKEENSGLKEKIRNVETEVNKALKFIHKTFRSQKTHNKSEVDLLGGLSRITKRSEQQIKTHNYIHEKLEQNLEDKIKETLELFKVWESKLTIREEEWRKNFERGLSEHSFDGISNFVTESFMINVKDKKMNESDNFYETSLYKRNEEELLLEMEKECEKSYGGGSVEKSKLVELDEYKENYKMVKQVNEQLYDELSKQENMIKIFKEAFKNLEQKKRIKYDDNEEMKKIRLIFGLKNI